MKLPTMKKTVEQSGEWIGNTKTCGRCEKNRLFIVRYGEAARDYFLVCDKCDVDPLEK